MKEYNTNWAILRTQLEVLIQMFSNSLADLAQAKHLHTQGTLLKVIPRLYIASSHHKVQSYSSDDLYPFSTMLMGKGRQADPPQ